MPAIQGVLLAFAATFIAAVNAISLEHIPFYKALSEGNSSIITTHGPFTFSASCDSSAVTLDVFVEATEEDYIFGSEDSPVNLLPGNTTVFDGVFSETSYGNDYLDGGFVSASGYYVGWDGESVIGLHISSGTTQDLFGDNISCVISGVVKLITR